MELDRFLKAQRQNEYVATMRPVFRKRALFSDTTKNYVTPQEPAPYDQITIRFRSAKDNIDRVYFVSKGQRELMLREESTEQFDYYSVKVQLENELLAYHFEIKAGKIECCYDQRGAVKEASEQFYFRIIPGFKTPDWAKGAVMYQIFVDRFRNGDPSNDVLTGEYRYIGEPVMKAEDWDAYPDSMDVRRFYGGDLQGVIDKLDYLQELGIDVIYLNPVFVSPSNHKYDIQDYDYIDPHFGKIVYDEGELLSQEEAENRLAERYINRVTDKRNLEASNELFAELVREAHKRNIKIILDGVFNHCGSFNKWMDRERIYENAPGYEKGAYVSAESPYRNYFRFYHDDQWPYNHTYDGWWGHDTLPKLNYSGSKELYDYILHVAKKWVSEPYCADGWRLDVAADLGHTPEENHKFWQDFRKAVKEANPNALILAEHYGNPESWLRGNEWDSVMNYDAFMEPVSWFLTGMQKHSDDYRGDLLGNAFSFWETMKYHNIDYTMPSWQVAMNELSNHDHSRFLTRTNRKVGRTNTLGPKAAEEGVNKAVFREAVVIQMTWIGAPTIYYGDEAGVCGFTDPDNRRTYPWGHEDHEMIEFHKEMIRIHKQNREMIEGSLMKLCGDPNFLAYARFTETEQSIVLLNNAEQEATKEISVWETGIPKETIVTQIMRTDADGFTTEAAYHSVKAGKLKITLPPTSAFVLKYRQKERKNFLQFE
ncbi:MAG: glycoside hydrolase family 13 protein [Lachnospiraceae bacterium]|nr:glycoside hydrolase family 13 protein [Lachnospiraceae bacterium]